jgi:hypothetical protein
MSSCIQRKTGSQPTAEAAPATPADTATTLPWHAGRFVRLILFLLILFFFLHLALWKVVYDFIMDANHSRLYETVQTAWARLKDTVNALD